MRRTYGTRQAPSSGPGGESAWTDRSGDANGRRRLRHVRQRRSGSRFRWRKGCSGPGTAAEGAGVREHEARAADGEAKMRRLLNLFSPDTLAPECWQTAIREHHRVLELQTTRRYRKDAPACSTPGKLLCESDRWLHSRTLLWDRRWHFAINWRRRARA
jgi:hypothetical protein